MKKLSLSSIALSAGLSLAAIPTVIAAPASAPIPNRYYPFAGECPNPSGGAMRVDPWNFYKCECTSYVASRLNRRGVPFSNQYKSPRWGNASNWSAAAKAADIPQDDSNVMPRWGDVAWFKSGHVAYVERVLPNGTIDISEYNYQYRHNYGTRNIPINSVSKFIHFYAP
ncbi:MAG: CHAP domain-containing protein [Pseudanabaenaceae cyanobacterium]|jgi:surface antigen